MTAIYGHRGARGEMPENTIEGFRHAQAAGAAGIETDIAVTADFCAVLHHDPELPDGRLIRALNFAALPGIPTLAAALRAIPETDWLLEIKTFPDQPEKTHSAALMVRAVRAALACAALPPSRLHVLAFDWAVLAELRAQAPELRRVCLTAPATEAARKTWWGPGYDALTTPQAVARAGAQTWAPWFENLTPAHCAEAHARGLQIIPWTVNETADVARLLPLVDGLITDYPSRHVTDH